MQRLDSQKALIQVLENGAASFNTLVDSTAMERATTQACLDKLETIGVISSQMVANQLMYHLCAIGTGKVSEAVPAKSTTVASVPIQVRELLIKAGTAGIETANLTVQGSRAAAHAALQFWKKKHMARLEGTRWIWIGEPAQAKAVVQSDEIDIPVKLKNGAEIVLQLSQPKQKPPKKLQMIEPVSARLDMCGLFTISGYGQELLVDPENARQLGEFLSRTASVARAI